MASKKRTPKSGDVLFVPLNNLKKSPKNVRQMPHTKTDIETLAASISANGLLQNLIVEPEQDKKGRTTGYYLVTAGEGRVERGFVRKEDEPQHGETATGDQEIGQGTTLQVSNGVSDKLMAELTAHRTAALRNELADNPETALIATVHALAAATFYGSGESLTCLHILPRPSNLATHAPGIDETKPMREIGMRDEAWRNLLPEETEHLWDFVAALDMSGRLQLLAHCVCLTVNAVRLPHSYAPQGDALAQALRLDMTRYWQPSATGYFSRVSKERILEAVRECVSDQAAQNISNLKKQAMAEHAERLLAGRGWLPPVLRTQESPATAVTLAAAE
jgi:ParB family transcriptional regulator, chromosome partitioning protein